MRAYRQAHPALSTPYVRKFRQKNHVLENPTSSQGELRLEGLRTMIVSLSIIIVEITGLLVILTFCVKHVLDLWGLS
jgi:hypothetical protein